MRQKILLRPPKTVLHTVYYNSQCYGNVVSHDLNIPSVCWGTCLMKYIRSLHEGKTTEFRHVKRKKKQKCFLPFKVMAKCRTTDWAGICWVGDQSRTLFCPNTSGVTKFHFFFFQNRVHFVRYFRSTHHGPLNTTDWCHILESEQIQAIWIVTNARVRDKTWFRPQCKRGQHHFGCPFAMSHKAVQCIDRSKLLAVINTRA